MVLSTFILITFASVVVKLAQIALRLNFHDSNDHHVPTCCLLSSLPSLELSHSPKVRPAIVVNLGLTRRSQLQVTHLAQRVGPTLTWKTATGISWTEGNSYIDESD